MVAPGQKGAQRVALFQRMRETGSPLPRSRLEIPRRVAVDQPAKKLHASAMERLLGHSWPGGVRELEHVLERGYILAEDRAEIAAAEIRFGSGR